MKKLTLKQRIEILCKAVRKTGVTFREFNLAMHQTVYIGKIIDYKIEKQQIETEFFKKRFYEKR